MATPTRPAPGSVLQAEPAVVEHDLGEPVPARARDARQEARAGEARDERVAGPRDEVRGRPLLHDLPSDDHADPIGKRGRVLEVVRDEDRRQPELAEELVQLGADGRLRVRVERRERLVEQQRRGPARERAGERDTLALAARELRGHGRFARSSIRNRSSSSPIGAPRGAPNRTFAATSRCGKSAYSWNR